MDSRDRMRARLEKAWPSHRPWWKRISALQLAGAAATVLALGTAAVWLMQDARNLVSEGDLDEGAMRVNVNTATVDELVSVPGIGKSLAALVVAGRPYKSVDELTRVRGISPSSLESLRPFVKVEGDNEKLRP